MLIYLWWAPCDICQVRKGPSLDRSHEYLSQGCPDRINGPCPRRRAPAKELPTIGLSLPTAKAKISPLIACSHSTALLSPPLSLPRVAVAGLAAALSHSPTVHYDPVAGQGKRFMQRRRSFRADQFERLFTGISNAIVANVYGCLAVGVAGDPNELGVLGAWSAVSNPMGTGNGSLFFASDRWLICSMGTHYDVPFHFRTLGKGLDLVILECSGSVAN